MDPKQRDALLFMQRKAQRETALAQGREEVLQHRHDKSVEQWNKDTPHLLKPTQVMYLSDLLPGQQQPQKGSNRQQPRDEQPPANSAPAPAPKATSQHRDPGATPAALPSTAVWGQRSRQPETPPTSTVKVVVGRPDAPITKQQKSAAPAPAAPAPVPGKKLSSAQAAVLALQNKASLQSPEPSGKKKLISAGQVSSLTFVEPAAVNPLAHGKRGKERLTKKKKRYSKTKQRLFRERKAVFEELEKEVRSLLANEEPSVAEAPAIDASDNDQDGDSTESENGDTTKEGEQQAQQSVAAKQPSQGLLQLDVKLRLIRQCMTDMVEMRRRRSTNQDEDPATSTRYAQVVEQLRKQRRWLTRVKVAGEEIAMDEVQHRAIEAAQPPPKPPQVPKAKVAPKPSKKVSGKTAKAQPKQTRSSSSDEDSSDSDDSSSEEDEKSACDGPCTCRGSQKEAPTDTDVAAAQSDGDEDQEAKRKTIDIVASLRNDFPPLTVFGFGEHPRAAEIDRRPIMPGHKIAAGDGAGRKAKQRGVHIVQNLAAPAKLPPQQSPSQPAASEEGPASSPVAPSDQLVITTERRRVVRDYVSNALTMELDSAVAKLLAKLCQVQAKVKKTVAKEKQRRQQRYLTGLRETLKGIKTRRVKLVIVAPDCEPGGGLDDHVQQILSVCHEKNIPFIFALSRAGIGTALKLYRASVTSVAVISGDGAYEMLHEVTAEASKCRDLYRSITSAFVVHDDSPSPADVAALAPPPAKTE